MDRLDTGIDHLAVYITCLMSQSLFCRPTPVIASENGTFSIDSRDSLLLICQQPGSDVVTRRAAPSLGVIFSRFSHLSS